MLRPRIRCRHLLHASLAVALCAGCGSKSSPPPPSRAADGEASFGQGSRAPDEEELPIAARSVPVEGDLPVFYVPGRRNTTGRMVFFHGACTHGLGYIQAFQFAASERGSSMALQGEHDCGRGYRSWVSNPEKTNTRVDAGFRAAGDTRNESPVTAIGYSQGALVAEALAAKYPSKYRRVILIGAPRAVNARSLAALEGAVLMAGTFDNRAVMKEGAAALVRIGVPATFIEIPNARHGQLPEGEKVMNEAFTWLEKHAKSDAGVAR